METVAGPRSGYGSADRVATAPLPVLRREGVWWTGGAGARPLRVHLALANPDDRPTASIRAHVQIAPLGLFRPGEPLTRIAVPPIPPGGRLALTATADGGEQRRRIRHAAGATSPRSPVCGRPACFGGSLRVFLDPAEPVDRSFARCVGLRPGRVQAVPFGVGYGAPDVYTFHVPTAEPHWAVELVPFAPGLPIELDAGRAVLRVRPPRRGGRGRVALAVHRRSTDTTELVELELETARR